MPIFPELWMAVSYYLRPKEPKKLLLVVGGRHGPNFVTLCYLDSLWLKTILILLIKIWLPRPKGRVQRKLQCCFHLRSIFIKSLGWLIKMTLGKYQIVVVDSNRLLINKMLCLFILKCFLRPRCFWKGKKEDSRPHWSFECVKNKENRKKGLPYHFNVNVMAYTLKKLWKLL